LRRDFGRWSPWGRFQRRLRAADALLYKEIERRRSAPDLEERSDVLSLLLRARDKVGEAMSDLELRDELMTMLLAGHETKATGLAFAFDLLPRNPSALARLRDELTGEEDTYREAVVTETLRVRLHDLRHTAATLWLGAGESIYFVQQQLGHATSRRRSTNTGTPTRRPTERRPRGRLHGGDRRLRSSSRYHNWYHAGWETPSNQPRVSFGSGLRGTEI